MMKQEKFKVYAIEGQYVLIANKLGVYNLNKDTIQRLHVKSINRSEHLW